MCYLVREGAVDCPFEAIVSRQIGPAPIYEGLLRGVASLEIRDAARFLAGILDLLDRRRRIEAPRTARFLARDRFWGDSRRTAALLGKRGNRFISEYLAEGVRHFAGEELFAPPAASTGSVETRLMEGMAPALERLGTACADMALDPPAEMLLQPCLGCGTVAAPLTPVYLQAAAGLLFLVLGSASDRELLPPLRDPGRRRVLADHPAVRLVGARGADRYPVQPRGERSVARAALARAALISHRSRRLRPPLRCGVRGAPAAASGRSPPAAQTRSRGV